MGKRLSGSPWRQGSVLSREAAIALGLVHVRAGDDPVVVVVSHDCDLATGEDIEPDCEVIPGCTIDKLDGNCTNAKNPRKLHLTFSRGTVGIAAEFVAADKRKIKKADLFAHAPASNIDLTFAEHSILQAWLAARYRRASFADEFDRRFKQGELYRKFVHKIKKGADHLLAVLFDVDSGEEVARSGADDTYSLKIYLIFNVTEDPSESERMVGDIAAEIDQLLRQHCFVNGKWRNIELTECMAMSEDAITIYMARHLKEWRFDYISLNEESEGPQLEKK